MSLTSYRAAPPRGGGCGVWEVLVVSLLGGPGGDLLFHALGRSTIGAEGFHGRVRDGIGCFTLAMATRSSKQRAVVAVPVGFRGGSVSCGLSGSVFVGVGLSVRTAAAEGSSSRSSD